MLKDNAFINPYILKNIKIITNLQILKKIESVIFNKNYYFINKLCIYMHAKVGNSTLPCLYYIHALHKLPDLAGKSRSSVEV